MTHLILSPTRNPEPPVRGLVGVWVSLGLVVLFILWDINNLAPADLIRFQNVVIICDGCMTSTKLYWIISKNGLLNAKFRNAKPPPHVDAETCCGRPNQFPFIHKILAPSSRPTAVLALGTLFFINCRKFVSAHTYVFPTHRTLPLTYYWQLVRPSV